MSPTHECTDKCEHRIGLIDMGAWDIMKARAERAERIVEAVKELLSDVDKWGSKYDGMVWTDLVRACIVGKENT